MDEIISLIFIAEQADACISKLEEMFLSHPDNSLSPDGLTICKNFKQTIVNELKEKENE